jgi:hypothetical protein
VCNVEVARCNLMEHHREQKEVVAADERDRHARIRAEGLFEMDSRVDAAKASTEDQNPVR